MKHIIVFLIFLLPFVSVAYSQLPKRELVAKRTSEHIKIDGKLDETAWAEATVYTDFTQYEPYNGANPYLQTIIRFIYDDDALYIAAFMYDHAPDSMLRELSRRDEVERSNADLIAFYLIPFNDGQNAFVFRLSASGVQEDVRFSVDGEDKRWDAIWISAVGITDTGWVAEIRIPYASIRFPRGEEQIWDINFMRQIRRNREWSSLQFVDKNKDGFLTQSAMLKGISGIKPPLRLSMFPYVSTYLQKSPLDQKTGYLFNYGLDLKYGINQSYTVDMTLIPDFGHVQSDDQILNLSPFEVRYDEKRQFFTEGTELFNRAGLFYSRRIGGRPAGYHLAAGNLKDDEYIIENPHQGKLINATKLSGRGVKGTGLGAFNAMVAPSKAVIVDSNGTERSFITQDFSNYNIMVADQNIKNNSFVSIINTNVYRKNYLANVTGSQYALRNKGERYMLYGRLVYSHIDANDANAKTGLRNLTGFGKIAGNFRFNLQQDYISRHYNINDMGYFDRNNYLSHHLRFNYNIFKPFWKLHFWNNEVWLSHSSLADMRSFESFSMGATSSTRFRNHLSAGFNISGQPISTYDYYEARQPGLKFRIPTGLRYNIWVSPDYRKRFLIDMRHAYAYTSEFSSNYWMINLSPRFRVNEKILIVWTSELSHRKDAYGFVMNINDSLLGQIPLFGRRDNNVVQHILNTSYIISNKANLSLRGRHYWSTALHKDYYYLNNKGDLYPADYGGGSNDISFNSFNIDLLFTWYFAPGSEFNIVWKYAVFTHGNFIPSNYMENVEDMFSNPALNSLSLRILYYFDWKQFRK